MHSNVISHSSKIRNTAGSHGAMGQCIKPILNQPLSIYLADDLNKSRCA